MTTTRFDAVIVGAGFSGLYLLHKLQAQGLSVRLFEAGDEVGGTWHWNRYPGARCDVESLDYSYSFDDDLASEWVWTERYAPQPEIYAYLRHVADRFDLRRDIAFSTRVDAAEWAQNSWQVTTDQGDTVEAGLLFMATGSLSAANIPELPGLDGFTGQILHTAQWPDTEVDFAGKRVGVIGTGSSGIQVIPQLARRAAHLTVFQRTPNFSLPARNHERSPEQIEHARRTHKQRRASALQTPGGWNITPGTLSAQSVSDVEREKLFRERWDIGGIGMTMTFGDLLTDAASNDLAADFVRDRIRETVRDPATAEMLCPTGYPFAAKRPCVDIDYFETYNRPNVTLVDVRAHPITGLTVDGLRAGDQLHELDILVFATGFDAMTGALAKIDILGRGGLALQEAWADGPRTYLGVATAGFPNLFVLAGPGSPSVLTNVAVSIEQHVEWLAEHVEYLRANGFRVSEAQRLAQDDWVEHVNTVASATLYPQADSWYLGANIPGKPRRFMPYPGGIGPYRAKCDAVAAAGYEGFNLS
ncbi:flavin-containing monooxygenase [Tomitella biformata]|uniref:flavin-containing monooxygenase n=1 Tax=Tomitella biformata TaxID=630403 RepID=UPI000462F58D|nr:NAD(P)/FAD-dependent oxidoreductase [Tomitella biformata]